MSTAPPSVSKSEPPASSHTLPLRSDPNAAFTPLRRREHPANKSSMHAGDTHSSYPLRFWLLSAFFLTIGITGITSSIVGVWLIGKGISEQAQAKAQHDLNAAHLIFQNRLERLGTNLRIASLRETLTRALEKGELDGLRAEAAAIKKDWNYDYVTILDGSGRVLARSDSPVVEPEPHPSAVVAEVLAGKRDATGTVVRDSSMLARESPQLTERARLVVRNPDGTPLPPREVSAGLVLEGAAAVANASGKIVAILLSGILLNHDEITVDLIKDTLFALEANNGHATGGSSLCLGDVRVSTSIRMANGERAVGTILDPIVKKRVLDENTPLVDRAMVLGDVYFTAYEPIHDPSGQPIGVLSLGVPARNFAVLRNEALAIFIGIVLCGSIVASALAGLIGRRVLYPVQQLARTIRSYAKGDLEARVGPFTHTPTELIELGNGLGTMARALHERELQLKFHTEQQLGKSERLAMIGRLSAGVAHEINNPLGGILLFASLLLKKTGEDHPDRSAIERICNETKRCQKIVQGLLDFARPREPKREQIVLQDVVERTLQLVVSQSLFHNIELIKDYADPKPECHVDPAQLQQVILNLVVNAAEAMEGNGTLTITTSAVEDGQEAQLEIADSGCGILPENLERLFEPFFTTKEVGRGTGLGLSISRSIIESHHGTIWAESSVGTGTSFFIRLPAKAKESPSGERS